MTPPSWLNHMFANATSFNQPIGDWNVSELTNMDAMFQGGAARFSTRIMIGTLRKHCFSGVTAAKSHRPIWNVPCFMMPLLSIKTSEREDWNIIGVTNKYTINFNSMHQSLQTRATKANASTKLSPPTQTGPTTGRNSWFTNRSPTPIFRMR